MKYLVLIALLLAVLAHAGGDDIKQINKQSNDVGDTVISGDKALGIGFSYGMGDVDINEGKNCMGSKQKANILFGKQELALNPWCASLFYELNGRHEFAAKMRCDIPEILAKYTTFDECVIDQELGPSGEVTESPVLKQLAAKAAQYEIHEEEDDEKIEYLEQQVMQQQQQLEQLSNRPARVTREVVQPQPLISKELANELRVKK
jgi:hypothetical protein